MFFFLSELKGEVAYRKRLYNIVLSVLAAHKAEYTFVNSTPYGELEVRVVPQLHIRKILV